MDEVCAAIGSDRVGIRFSPFSDFNDGGDTHPYALYAYLLEELNKRNLAYVHFVEPRVGGNDDRTGVISDSLAPFRAIYKGNFMSAGGFNQALAASAVAAGEADLIAFGRHFVSTPDLVERVRKNVPFNNYDRNTFYSQGDNGYLDYPTL